MKTMLGKQALSRQQDVAFAVRSQQRGVGRIIVGIAGGAGACAGFGHGVCSVRGFADRMKYTFV
ncbi:hypothetical protein LP415_00770 [Polaromonas sp. P1(28)-8]|nr:hypothetical protein LP415_00770 [Polaromonas sp. P1(28)-8]